MTGPPLRHHGSRRPSPAPAGAPSTAAAAWGSLALGLVALAWLPASLWPDAGLPAWPAVSLGLLALLVSWGRGGALVRSLGAVTGTLAALGGAVQIAVLWGAAWAVSYM